MVCFASVSQVRQVRLDRHCHCQLGSTFLPGVLLVLHIILFPLLYRAQQ